MTLKISLDEYIFNEKNSNKGEAQTRLDPGCPPEIAINISSLHVEAKTSDLKKLKVGNVLNFEIDEEITLSVPDYKAKEDREVSHYAKGSGYGDIEDIEMDDTLENEEIQDARIVLNGGYAESL